MEKMNNPVDEQSHHLFIIPNFSYYFNTIYLI